MPHIRGVQSKMVRMMGRDFLRAVMAMLVVIGVAVTGSANAQSVLKVARGLQSNQIGVLINRAVVLDSAVQFAEVSVANPEIADVSPLSNRSIYIFGRQRGATTLTLLGENGRLITNVTIKVEADHSELKLRLKQLLPNEPIQVRTANGGLVLSGVVSGKAKIDRAMSLARAYAGDAVTNMMSVGGTQQVMLKVKIAEISRAAGKDIGVSFASVQNGNRVNSFTQSGESINNNLGSAGNVADELGNNVAQFENALGLAAAGAFGSFGALFAIAEGVLLDIQIDALEQKGFARILAEPNLVSLSGTEANFLAGGEVPVPTIDDEGDISIAFKPVGVNLNFLPQVLDDDLINLSVSAEVSEVNQNLGIVSQGIEIVGFNVRRATTTVEMRDGQSFAIAGLLQDDFEDAIQQVPWLGDIPILGTLFRSTNYQRNETELVIFVTANLVTPVDSEDELSLPTDRIALPNEFELFLLGHTTGAASEGGSGVGLTGAGFDGAYGYIVE